MNIDPVETGKNSKQLVLGIMSGTSIDSVDYALCQVESSSIRLREWWSARFPPALQKRLHAAARGDSKTYELGQLHHDLGRFYAAHAAGCRVDLAGLHGQTVFHNPSSPHPATLQIGEPAYLVETLEAPVVSNFRAADIAAGGQGAPLATIFHTFVFSRRGSHVCVNNLGGFSNVTSINWPNGHYDLKAFDTGPANILIDLAMRHLTGGKMTMDKDGRWAARGQACQPLLEQWLRHPFFRRKPPKSTGRELFGEVFFNQAIRQMASLSPFDVVATFTEFAARSIALNYRLHLASLPDKIILAGGGASNPVLVAAIASQFAGGPKKVQVLTSAARGWPVQAVEPAAFALLAWLRMAELCGNFPRTTGATHPAVLGQVSCC